MSVSVSTQSQLEQILDLDEIDNLLYRGYTPKHSPYPRVYGGQLLGQALRAASHSVPNSFSIHSLHSYFLRPGDPKLPIVYQVHVVRDGESFAVRNVQARQKGKPIFSFQASFQKKSSARNLLNHQVPIPDAPSPKVLLNESELMKELSKNEKMSARFREVMAKRSDLPFPMDIRYCNPLTYINIEQRSLKQMLWMKSMEKLSDDPIIHQCVAAYGSDSALVSTMLLPHGMGFYRTDIAAASLDHAMWFHDDFRADKWLLYELESPRTSNSRGLAFGKMYDAEGNLVVSVAQEGLLRYTPQPNPKL
jgi:acyl-CoA thioesterase II